MLYTLRQTYDIMLMMIYVKKRLATSLVQTCHDSFHKTSRQLQPSCFTEYER